MARGQARAGIGHGEPNLKHAGQRQAEEKEQQRHDRDKAGRLELEAPAQLTSSGLQPQQQGNHGPEGNQNSQGVNQTVGTDPAVVVTGRFHQGKALDEQDGKDAGHEVENHAAQEGQSAKAQKIEQAGAGARRCGAGNEPGGA